VLVDQSPLQLGAERMVDGNDVGVHWIAPFMV
jgi:hypothetical protein